jgi:hypothetical protein
LHGTLKMSVREARMITDNRWKHVLEGAIRVDPNRGALLEYRWVSRFGTGRSELEDPVTVAGFNARNIGDYVGALHGPSYPVAMTRMEYTLGLARDEPLDWSEDISRAANARFPSESDDDETLSMAGWSENASSGVALAAVLGTISWMVIVFVVSGLMELAR